RGVTILEDRLDTMNKLASLENMESSELAKKAKVKWSIEGDENSKFFHGIINKCQNNLSIRGIMVDGDWKEDPTAVKKEVFSHFQNIFDAPCATRLSMDMEFPNRFYFDQALDFERHFSKEEIKGSVWDCGLNKSPRPDGFTFGFYHRYWSLLEDEVVEAVNHFLNYCFRQKGGNSSFIALILKTQGAKLVKDFRPIILIGSLYKIITKLLANRLVTVIGNLVNDVQSAFIANHQILNGPFIFNELIHWCKAKKKETMIFKVDFEKAFDSVRWDFLEDVLKNFGFGSRWCDWIVSCLKSSKGSLSHLFYADDAIFIGKLMGVAVENSLVTSAANNIGCMTLSLSFSYLGVNVGGHMSQIDSWDVVINKVLSHLSKWKMKVLSVGDRLTLLKLVLGSTPIYYVSLFKAPVQTMLVKWNNVLASNGMGGVDLLVSIKKKVGNGENTMFWDELWKEKRNIRGGAEQVQMASLLSLLEGLILPNMIDRWMWSISGDGEFSVSSRIKLNNLPTRLNLSRRGLELQTILFPSCNLAVESTDHLFFSCSMMKDLYASIAKWWDVNMPEFSSFEEWWEWFSNFRLSSKLKMLLEGVFYVAWWLAWNFRNKSIFGPNIPLKARLFDDVVAFSLSWFGGCDSGGGGDGGFRRKDGILGNGFLSVSLNVNGSDGNLGKKFVAAGDGDGVVKKKKVGLRLRGKPAAVNTTNHLWAGAVAAMVSRTTIAPLERLKLE
nr:RNA-directed DNA polymerase, eukaryota [Tanacetum cinerariifolium]